MHTHTYINGTHKGLAWVICDLFPSFAAISLVLISSPLFLHLSLFLFPPNVSLLPVYLLLFFFLASLSYLGFFSLLTFFSPSPCLTLRFKLLTTIKMYKSGRFASMSQIADRKYNCIFVSLVMCFGLWEFVHACVVSVEDNALSSVKHYVNVKMLRVCLF